MTKMESSANLINNLLLNLDNLKIQTENNKNIQNNISSSLQEQLNLLKSETERLTSQYTQSSTTNKNNKSKKIPPPIITGVYNKRSKFQTIDDMLFDLNNVSYQTYGGQTPSAKSNKGRKIPSSFVDPRRYSDPYKYTILSTLDETEDGEEEDDAFGNTPRTPKTALPYYSRKKDYSKNLTCNTNLKVSLNSPIAPKSACASTFRNRSYSQPERTTSLNKTNNKSNLHESATLNYNQEKINRASNEYFKKLNSIKNEKENKINNNNNKKNENKNKYLKVNNEDYIKPPRSSSINKHGNYFTNNKDDSSSTASDSSDNEPIYNQYHIDEITITKKKGNSALENKSSFYSDITLINDDE